VSNESGTQAVIPEASPVESASTGEDTTSQALKSFAKEQSGTVIPEQAAEVGRDGGEAAQSATEKNHQVHGSRICGSGMA
jgi:hypothetical protein